MRALSKLAVAALAFTAFGVSACGDDAGGNNETRITVKLTDAAGDIQAAVVTISEVYLQGADKVVLSSTPFTIDLTDLAQSSATIVDGKEIPAGTYSELRFVITGGYIQVDDGNGGSEIYASSADYDGLPDGAVVTGDLQMPSLGQSGLKVDFADGDLVLEGDEEFLVDFDVSQSFGHEAGNSGKWVMHPVIKGATLVDAASVTVHVSLGDGVTLPELNGTQLTLGDFSAKLGDETVDLTDSDADGVYEAKFAFLLPGTYTLTLVEPDGVDLTTDPTLSLDVDLSAGEDETVDLTVTGAALTVTTAAR